MTRLWTKHYLMAELGGYGQKPTLLVNEPFYLDKSQAFFRSKELQRFGKKVDVLVLRLSSTGFATLRPIAESEEEECQT